MAKKIMTLNDLYMFFVQQNKSFNFSSKESGEPIIVTTNGHFATTEDNDMPGMLKLKLKVCHTETNRNGSHISTENMEKAMPTIKYRPILAYIHELPDGTKDFYAHNVEFVEDENGETQVVYIEKQVGCFTVEDPWLEYDEEMDKTYVMAYAVIPEEYTETADIIRRKNGTKVSCELVINELAYNAKEKYLDLTDFYFGATTLLGCDEDGNEIGEGMLGARADITDFCHKEPVFKHQDKLIETLEKLNNTLSSFNKNSEEGGDEEMDNVENIVVEETFEETTEEVVVEEVETTEETHSEEETIVDETSTSEEDDNNQDEPAEEEKFTKTFTVELSHEEVNCALYNLIAPFEEEDNEWYYLKSVYNNYFYMQGWFGGKIYKVGYSIDGENVALDGERQEMFELIVSESEKMAIEKMREDYAALETKYNELKSFKEQYDASQVKAEKDVIFNSAEYDGIRESDEFKQLVSDAEKYTVDEIKVKVDLLFAASMKKKFNFEAKPEKKNTVGMHFNEEPSKKKQAYGGLFEND
ncbi:MAG: hypothetical protein IJ444_01870 [Kiritimatiellae bacterium]|nr:hypothetical protein [Kiritimatiellia bacterium]